MAKTYAGLHQHVPLCCSLCRRLWRFSGSMQPDFTSLAGAASQSGVEEMRLF